MKPMDRGALAKIDRRILSVLGHNESYQMIRVPTSEALWSTWRRYRAALGTSMGRAIAGLIGHELDTPVHERLGQSREGFDWRGYERPANTHVKSLASGLVG